MSYSDPYRGQNARYQYQGGQHYDQPGYEFNPYSNNGYQQQSFPQSPPSSSSAFTPAGSGHTPSKSLSGPFAPYSDDPNPFAAQGSRHKVSPSRPENDVYYSPGDSSFKNIKDYRSHYQGNLWTGGSRIGCFGRFFCCTLLIAVYIFLSVVAGLALWLRPPGISIGDPSVNTTKGLNFVDQALIIPLGLNISVNNPTYVSVKVEDLSVDLTYPVTNSPEIGNGTVTGVNLHSNAQTNFTLPIDLEASTDTDGLAVVQDIVDKCGLLSGGSGGSLSVDANIHIKLRALSVPVRFTISRNLSFGCPQFPQEVLNALKSIIGALSAL